MIVNLIHIKLISQTSLHVSIKNRSCSLFPLTISCSFVQVLWMNTLDQQHFSEPIACIFTALKGHKSPFVYNEYSAVLQSSQSAARHRAVIAYSTFINSVFKMFSLSALGVLLALCGGAFSHTYHLGACPVVEPMPGFEMNKVCTYRCIYFIFIVTGIQSKLRGHVCEVLNELKIYYYSCHIWNMNNKDYT